MSETARIQTQNHQAREWYVCKERDDYDRVMRLIFSAYKWFWKHDTQPVVPKTFYVMAVSLE